MLSNHLLYFFDVVIIVANLVKKMAVVLVGFAAVDLFCVYNYDQGI